MASESGGFDVGQTPDSEPFTFKSGLTVYKTVGDEEEEIEDQTEILATLGDLESLNKNLECETEVVEVKQSQVTWAVRSNDALQKMVRFVEEGHLKKQVAVYAFSRGLGEKLNVQLGEIEIEIVLQDTRRLLVQSKKHFEEEQRKETVRFPPEEPMVVQPLIFGTDMRAYIVKPVKGDDEDLLSDSTEVEECLRNIEDVNHFIGGKAKVTAISEGTLTWYVNSEEAFEEFIAAYEQKQLQKKLTEYVAKQQINDKLHLTPDKSIDVDIVLADVRRLKNKAKGHFKQGKREQPSSPEKGIFRENIDPSQQLNIVFITPSQDQATTSPMVYTGIPSFGTPSPDRLQPGYAGFMIGEIDPQENVKVPSPSGPSSQMGDKATSETLREDKFTEMVLYIAQEAEAYSVKLKYKYENEWRSLNMTYDKEFNLWFSGKLKYPPNHSFCYRFEVYKKMLQWSPSYKDDNVRWCFSFCPYLRVFLENRYEATGFKFHLQHFVSTNGSQLKRCDLANLDKLCSAVYLNREAKEIIFRKFTTLIDKNESLQVKKGYAVLGYIFAKFDLEFKESWGDSMELSKTANEVLKSFDVLTHETVSAVELPMLRRCAVQMCKIVFQQSACVLNVMQYCFHLFSSLDFLEMQREKALTFSSRESDGDLCLHLQLLEKQSELFFKPVVSPHANSLFDMLVEHIPLKHTLQFDYEKYPPAISERVEFLLSNPIQIEISVLKTTKEWSNFVELCNGVSKHHGLSATFSPDLTNVALCLLRSSTSPTAQTDATLENIFTSSVLFRHDHEREELLEVISKSPCKQLHSCFMRILERMSIENFTVIYECSLAWLDTLIQQFEREYKTSVDYIKVLYINFQSLFGLGKIRRDSKLVNALKENVYKTIYGMDPESVVRKSLEKDFKADELFFMHLEQIALVHKKEMLRILNDSVDPDSDTTFSRLRVTQIGLDLLVKLMIGNTDENLYILIQYWRVCLFVLKHCQQRNIRNKENCKTVLQTLQKYWKLLKNRDIEVHVIRKLCEMCSSDNFLIFSKLFSGLESKARDTQIISLMESYASVICEAESEVQSVLSVLKTMSEEVSSSQLPFLKNQIEFIKEKVKNFEIGLQVKLRDIADRSYFEIGQNMLLLCKKTQYLWKSKMFLKIFKKCFPQESKLENDGERLIADLFDLIQDTEAAYLSYWKRLYEEETILIADIYMIPAKDLDNETQTAEKAMGKEVPADIKDALQLAGDYTMYIEKTDVLKRVSDVLGVDTSKDTQFTNAVSAFTALETQKDTMETLVSASQTFREIDKLMDIETVDMLKEFAESQYLLRFIQEIKHEDLRNFIDAVEEHSEQSVQEVTVSSLIDVRRFLRPLLETKLPDSVLQLLNIMENSVKDNKLIKLAQKLKECNTNLHSLKSLYHNLANRGEVTKDIAKALLKDENATFAFNATSIKSKVVLTYQRGKEKKTLTSNEINDYRSRALLLVNTESKELNKKSDTEMKVDLNKFIELVDSAMAISNLYEQLVTMGHPDYSAETTLNERKHDLSTKETHLRHSLSTWEDVLERARSRWYWINHFYPEQLRKVKAFFVDASYKDEIQSLFLSAGCNPATLTDAQTVYTRYLSSGGDDEFGLFAVGETLDELMKNNIVVGPEFPKDEEYEPKSVRPLEKVQKGQVYVINWEENSVYVIPTLMALYRNTTGRIPCHHQLLFCTEETTWESVQLLLNRSVGGKKKGFDSQLYCIVNVEKLRNEEQFKLVFKLKELGNSIQYLAVICRGNINHPLVNHFSENVHVLRPMLTKAMSNCLRLLRPNVTVVTSNLPGQGKTEEIQCDSFQRGLDIVSVHVSGFVSDPLMISKLNKTYLENDSLLHLDIGTVSAGEEVDIILFRLCIFGFLSNGPKVFHCPTQHISIEIANTISDTLWNSLPTTKYFKSSHLRWQNFGNLKVSYEVNSPIQVVSHYLRCLALGSIDSTDLYFCGAKRLEPITKEECRQLLGKQFSSVADMTFSLLNSLLGILADQLKKMSCSLFLRTSNLYEMVSDNTIKSSFFIALLAVSTEFATRSVLTCRQKQTETVKTEIHLRTAEVLKSNDLTDFATASAMIERVQGMIQWEESNHLVIAFHNLDVQTISVLYRDTEKVPEHVKTLFETQMNKDLPDFSSMTDSDLKEKLRQIAQFKPNKMTKETSAEVQSSYAMTPDNLLKMVLIMMRIKSHIPVIIMGETGCGKTSLLRYLANICGIHFLVKNMHAGIEEEDINQIVQEASLHASNMEHVWLFFDEINTCSHLGLLNDILCHHVFSGRKLPPNLSIIAACNPYKLRMGNKITAGLDSKVKTDEQSKLVYRVQPLPERMIDYVWDYGSLSDSDEKAYISSMVSGCLQTLPKDMLVDLLVMSQTFIRDVEKSPFCVSLRDVNRCRLLIPWFREEMLKEISSHKNRTEKEMEAVILALAHSYHSRLNEIKEREQYRKNVESLLQRHDEVREYNIDGSGQYVFGILNKIQKCILDKMELPYGIAKNTALQENVFVIFVCLLKHLPIFVVGKPGCSKSLSLQLLRSNLRGKDSMDKYFKKLPQLYFVSFQGSKSSTSDGILKVFDKAQKYRLHNKEEDVLPVVILDEIGLAEVSPLNPLKVLHSLLEPEQKEFPDIAVVGISNWALDAAKMNRAIHLSRPDMDAKELHATGVSIAEASNETNRSRALTESNRTTVLSEDDDTILKALANAYSEYVVEQKIKNFHGLRDFYSLVKFITRESGFLAFSRSDKCSTVLRGLLRNFGGLESEIKYVIETFNKHLEKTLLPPLDLSYSMVPSLLQLIDENIKDKSARHLMLLTRGDSSLGIVEDLLRSNERQYITILGSCFEEDKTDHYNYRILSKIILCMEQGITLILKDLESIYGSLYDMLNQNYTTVGSKKNCRIALGAYSNPLCQVDDNFRCIVLVEEQKVDLSDPPFLNRFEKQRLAIGDVLESGAKMISSKFETSLKDMSKVFRYESMSPTKLIPIYSPDMVPSLVHSQFKTIDSKGTAIGDIDEACLQKILTVCTPEGMIRAEKSALMTKDGTLVKSWKEKYFDLAIHDDVETFFTRFVQRCDNGVVAMVFTHSNVYTDIEACMGKISKSSCFEKLGSFKSEKQLSSRIQQFFTDPLHDWMFIQVTHEDQKHFLVMKSLLEQERKRYLSSKETLTPKHVVVIIHIDRAAEDTLMGLVNFLSGWDMAMVDSLETHSIPLKCLLERTLADVAGLLLKEGISNQDLFSAFTCIHYTDVSRSMDSIRFIIDFIRDDKDILHIILDIVQKWIDGNISLQNNKTWQSEVACNSVKLRNFLTFHGALLEEVKTQIRHPLAAAVFTVENLNGWDCLTSNNVYQVNTEKLTLWKELLKNKRVVDISSVTEPKGPECYPCKVTTLSTRFPFSKFFIHTIEGLEKIFLDIWRIQHFGTNRDEGHSSKETLFKMFRRHVNTVAPELFHYSYGKEQFKDYFHDFCHWFTTNLPLNMSEDQRIEVIGQIIKSRTSFDDEDFDVFVTKLHVTVWMYKKKLQSELLLIDTCLSQLGISLSDILKHIYIVKKREKKKASHTSSVRESAEIPGEDLGEHSYTSPSEDINSTQKETFADETTETGTKSPAVEEIIEDLSIKCGDVADSSKNIDVFMVQEYDERNKEVENQNPQTGTVHIDYGSVCNDSVLEQQKLSGNKHDEGQNAKQVTKTDSNKQSESRMCDVDTSDDTPDLSLEQTMTITDRGSIEANMDGDVTEIENDSHDRTRLLHSEVYNSDDENVEETTVNASISKTDDDEIDNRQRDADKNFKNDEGMNEASHEVGVELKADESASRHSEQSEISHSDDSVAANLVDLACQYLVPSQELRKDQTVASWQNLVNLVLTLTTDVSIEPAILQTLRACTDLASIIILPHPVDERLFWEMGSKLSTETLDSDRIVHALKELAKTVLFHVPSHDLKHFLSCYTSCCLMADDDTDFVSKLFEINQSFSDDINDVQYLGSVLHHALYLQFDDDPEELLQSDPLQNDFFQILEEWLKKSQEKVEDSSLGTLLADILQNHLFINLSEKLEANPSGFIERLIELKRQYNGEQIITLKSVILVAYLKGSLKCLASFINGRNMTENLWHKLNQVFEGSELSHQDKVQAIQAYFLKCLVRGDGLRASIGIKINFSRHIDFFSSIETAPDKRIMSLEQNPLALRNIHEFMDVSRTVETIATDDIFPLKELLKKTLENERLTYSLFAFALHKFFLTKTVRTLTANEEEMSVKIVSVAKEELLPDQQLRLLSRLCQQEEFAVNFLHSPSTVNEYHVTSVILDVLSTVLASCLNVESSKLNIFLDCICNLDKAKQRYIPGCTKNFDDFHSLNLTRFFNGWKSLWSLECECCNRLLFEKTPSECPHCGKDLKFQKHPIPHQVQEQFDEDISKMKNMIALRELNQVSFRVLQLIYVSCLTGGVAMKHLSEIELRSLLGLEDKMDMTIYLQNQLSIQWECLKDLLSMGDEQLARFIHVVLKKTQPFLTDPKWHLGEREERLEFEKEISQQLMPLVKRRFQIIMEQVRNFNEICSDKKDGFLEDVLCEIFEEGKKYDSLPHFWREVSEPCEENMRMEFLLTESQDRYLILSLVFRYTRELSLAKHIWSLIQWHICTVKHISYRYKKKECKVRTLADFRHSLKADDRISGEVNQVLDDFIQSWLHITKMRTTLEQYGDDIGQLYNIHPYIELEKCLVMNSESKIFKVLKALVRMQNQFLDDAMSLTVLQKVLSSSFLVRSQECVSVPVVKIEDIDACQIVRDPDFHDLLKFSQCNTSCGHGREVHYDFYQIERDISIQCLLNKAHINIENGFPQIAFSGEIQHTTSALLQEIEQLLEQEPLSPETKHQIDKMDPADRKVLMSYLEMTFCLLKRTPVSPADKKRFLSDFLESWKYLFPYRVQAIDNFCCNIYLCNTVALYEVVEKHMAADVVDSLEDKFRVDIPKEALPSLSGIVIFGKIELLDALVTALSKYAYRNLQSSDADPEEQMSVQLKDPSLWPKGVIQRVYIAQEDIEETEDDDLLPPSICAKHIFQTVTYCRTEIKKLQQKARYGGLQQKQKETRSRKSKTWRR